MSFLFIRYWWWRLYYVEWVNWVMWIGIRYNRWRSDGQWAVSSMYHIQTAAFVKGEVDEKIQTWSQNKRFVAVSKLRDGHHLLLVSVKSVTFSLMFRRFPVIRLYSVFHDFKTRRRTYILRSSYSKSGMDLAGFSHLVAESTILRPMML